MNALFSINRSHLVQVEAESLLWHALADQLAKHLQGVSVGYGMDGFHIYVQSLRVVIGQDELLCFEFLNYEGQPEDNGVLPYRITDRSAEVAATDLLKMMSVGRVQ